jgi:hypothetical protein
LDLNSLHRSRTARKDSLQCSDEAGFHIIAGTTRQIGLEIVD